MSLGSINKKGSQINTPECRQGFTLMQTQGLRFPPPPHYLSKSPKKVKLPLQVPLTEPHTHRKMLHLQSPLYIYSKFPEKKPPQVPFSEPHRNTRSVTRTLLYLSLAVPGERAPPTGSPSGPRWREMPITRAYHTYLSKFPTREPPSKFPPRPYGERCPSPGPSTRIIYKAQ
jgi:hypothetical protein